MHDVQLEQRLRRVLHEEAAEHPSTVSIDQVEVRLRARRRQRRFGQFGLLGAAAAFVVLVAGGAFLSGRLAPSSGVGVTPSPTIAPSPSPAPSAAEPLPSLAAVGGEFQLLHEEAFDGTGEPGSVETYVLGVIWPAERYRVSVVCRGPGDLDYALGGTIEEPVLGGAHEECDGRSPQVIEFSGLPPDTILLQPLVVTDASTAWQILIEGAGVRNPWPMMTARGQDGAVTESVMGCGIGFELGNGMSGADQCGPPAWPVIPADLAIHLLTGDELTFSLPDGWRIRDASVATAPTDQAGKEVAPSHVATIAEVAGLHDEVTVNLTDAGSFVVRLDATYERDGDRFSVPYFVGVTVVPWPSISVTGPADWAPSPGYELEVDGTAWTIDENNGGGLIQLDLATSTTATIRRLGDCSVVARFPIGRAETLVVRFDAAGNATVEDSTGRGIDTPGGSEPGLSRCASG